MGNVKNDDYYIRRIQKDIDFLIIHTETLTEKYFGKDEVLLDCIMFRLIQISENIRSLTPTIKINNKHIPWLSIVGLEIV